MTILKMWLHPHQTTPPVGSRWKLQMTTVPPSSSSRCFQVEINPLHADDGNCCFFQGKEDFSRPRIPSGVIRQASCFLVGAKTTDHFFLKFQHAIPSNMGMCKWFFKDATKIQNGRQRSTPNFFVGAKTLELDVRNYSNFTITFATIWRCAGVFLRLRLQFTPNTNQIMNSADPIAKNGY